MARSALWLVGGVVTGACLLYAIQEVTGPGGSPDGETGIARAGAGGGENVPARLVSRDIGSREDTGFGRAGSAPASLPVSLPPLDPASSTGRRRAEFLPHAADGGGGEDGASARRAAAYPSGLARSGSALAEAIEIADAAFASGDTRRGTRILRSVFLQAKGRHNVDLTREAQRLLEVDDDPSSRTEYIRYLQRKGKGLAAFEEQLARCAVLAEADDPLLVRRAWDELTIAHDVAVDDTQRRKVLALLEPFLDRKLFSGRFTPLVEEYSVKSGDRLWSIAVKFGTTVDAIQRLNGLSNDVIQPRTRLAILPGEAEIFVDKSEFRLWMKVGGRLLLERPIGLGRENRTPTGRFVVRVKQKDPTWYPPGEPPIPPGDPRNILGTRWLGFEDTDRYFGFGIHGTDSPGDIGRESSSGCIRLAREDMELLYDFVPRGTAVTILE